MTLEQYMQEVLRTYAGGDGAVHQLTLGVFGLAGESGEVVDSVKKWLYQGHTIDESHLAEELGDVLWYLALMSYAIGYDLQDVIDLNVQKLRARYPDGFDPSRSIHR